jgi:hypothetical protein
MDMKMIALALTIAGLNACGAPQRNDSELAGVIKDRVFSRDQRPVDGILTQITISNTGNSSFEVKLLQALVDRTTGAPAETTEVLGSKMKCAFSNEEILCSQDDRPVDGDLVELKLVSESGKWNATLRRAFFDRRMGKVVDTTDSIASQMIEEGKEIKFSPDFLKQIESTRISEVPFPVAQASILDLLSSEPQLASLKPELLIEIRDALLDFRNTKKSAKEVINSIVSK